MGYLHDGHLSLLREARRLNAHVVTTIFVNPTQFAPNEDLARYPRDEARDLELLRAEGVDAVFAPSVGEMYPEGFTTYVTVEGLTERLEGASRPTHFRGVTTVVLKLLNIVQPARAYFGQKDAQQAIVIRRLVRDLDMPVRVDVTPTVREPDGLAMSSRNVYLGPKQRKDATCLIRASTKPTSCWRRQRRTMARAPTTGSTTSATTRKTGSSPNICAASAKRWQRMTRARSMIWSNRSIRPTLPICSN